MDENKEENVCDCSREIRDQKHAICFVYSDNHAAYNCGLQFNVSNQYGH